MGPRHPNLDETAALAAELHAGQRDKAGEPYLGHLTRVVQNLTRLFPDASEAEQHAAWLHDSIEDTGITADALRARGYGERVIETVEAVTKPVDTHDYQDWIKTIAASGNISAMRVKLADLSDNADPARLSALPEPRAAMLRAKYAPAIAIIRAGLERSRGYPTPVANIAPSDKQQRPGTGAHQ